MAAMNAIRLWFSYQLLRLVWRILPRKHPAYRGVFDAAKALKEPT
jgi:hypothetical protein